MTTTKSINFNNLFIQDLTNDLSIAVPTLIALAIQEQPEIINIIKQISQIEQPDLQIKVKEFMNNVSFFDEYLNVVLSVYLSTLMYKNDIFPNFIHSVLVETGTTDITIEDLKLNSETLINMLINKQTNNIKGGNPFKKFLKMLKSLYPIAFVILVICIDYRILFNPMLQQSYQKASETYTTLSLVANPDKDCGYVEIPRYVEMFDKYNPQWNTARYYKAVMCVSQKNMDDYLESHPDFTPTYPKMETEMFSEDIVVEMSRELVPVDTSKMSTEIAIVGDKCSDMLNSIVVYDEKGVFNKQKSISKLDEYIDMSDEEIFNLFFPQDTKIERSDSSIGVQEMVTDAFSILYAMYKDVTKQTGISPAFSIKTSLSRTFKKYCIEKKRQIEDISRTTQRQIEDYIIDVAETFQDITEFLSLLPWLIGLNSAAMFIFLAFTRNLLGIRYSSTDRQQLEDSERVQIVGTDENIGSDIVTPMLALTSRDRSRARAHPTSSLENLPPPRRGGHNRKRKTLRNKKRGTKPVKRGKRHNTRHKKNRFTKRR